MKKKMNHGEHGGETPETDAFCGFHSEWVEFAKKLERERDKARKLAVAFHADQVDLFLKIQKLKIERDQALNKLQEVGK